MDVHGNLFLVSRRQSGCGHAVPGIHARARSHLAVRPGTPATKQQEKQEQQRQHQQAATELEVVAVLPTPLPATAVAAAAVGAAGGEPARFLSSQEVVGVSEHEVRSLTLDLTLADLASPAQTPVATAATATPIDSETNRYAVIGQRKDTPPQFISLDIHEQQQQQQQQQQPDRRQSQLQGQQHEQQQLQSPLRLDVLQMAAQDFPTKYAHFVARTSAMLDTTHTISARAVRLSLLDDSLRFLSFIRQHNIRSSLRVSFANKTGIDAGGFKREWFEALTQQLADPAASVFMCINQAEQTYTLSAGRGGYGASTVGAVDVNIGHGTSTTNSVSNDNSNIISNTVSSNNSTAYNDADSDHLLYCFGSGCLVGRALLEGQVLAFHLALPLLKVMLEQSVPFNDLEFFDPKLHASTVWTRSD